MRLGTVTLVTTRWLRNPYHLPFTRLPVYPFTFTRLPVYHLTIHSWPSRRTFEEERFFARAKKKTKRTTKISRLGLCNRKCLETISFKKWSFSCRTKIPDGHSSVSVQLQSPYIHAHFIKLFFQQIEFPKRKVLWFILHTLKPSNFQTQLVRVCYSGRILYFPTALTLSLLLIRRQWIKMTPSSLH